jgi:hypothetical protein
MSKADKLLTKMRNNTHDWRIEDIKTIADRYNLTYRQPGTSHVAFRTLTQEKLTIPAHKLIKVIYIKKFLALIDGLGGNNE